MSVPLHKRAKRAVRSVLLRGAIRLLALLPLGPALWLGAWLGRAAWLLAPRMRRLMLEHLAIAFPDVTDAERRRIAGASLAHLGQVAMEVIAHRSYGDRLEEYVSFAPGSEEVLRRAMARGKGVIFVAGHIGNWELLARRLALVVQPSAVIARRSTDAKLNELVARFRREGGIATLWREDDGTGRELIKLLRGGGALGILIDQDTRVQGVFVPFFGRLAYTPRAVGDLALRFGAAVLVGTCHRRGPLPGDGHQIEVAELSYDPSPADKQAEVQRVTAAAVAIQQRAIERFPAEWVWMHRRWKTRPAPEAPIANGMPKSLGLSEI